MWTEEGDDSGLKAPKVPGRSLSFPTLPSTPEACSQDAPILRGASE